MKLTLNILLSAIFIFIVTAVMIGCGHQKDKYGEDISDFKVTSIKSILDDSKNYEGKTVTLKGTVVIECPTGCWFNLKDDTGVIYVDLNPSGFAIPQIVKKTVVVQGTVAMKLTKPIVIGKGVEIQ